MNAPAPDRRLGVALAAVTLVALALRAWGLGDQPVIGDDLLSGQSARNFVQFGWPGPTTWHHPRLRDLLVYSSTAVLGANAWGLKIWGVLIGTLCVPATGWLVWTVAASRTGAVLAAAIVAIDPLHVHFSRQAANDVHVAAFPVAAVVALLVYAQRRRPWILVVAGLLLGLGLASKWPAAFPVGAAAVMALPAVVAGAGSRRERALELAFEIAALVLLPATVYVLTFWPWFGRGHDLAEFVRFQHAMGTTAATVSGYAGTGPAGYVGYQIGAWRWLLQPVWWVDAVAVAPSRTGEPGGVLFLAGVGNPITWLATLPAVCWAAWRWVRARDRGALLLLVVWAAAYLPFVVVPRPIYTNAAVNVVPFWAALVGLAAAHLWERSRALVAGWAAVAVVVTLLLWFPLAGRRFAPSNALVRAIVPPAALDPSSHPATTFLGIDAGP
ncbi:MAG TPA: phospholipid carrier-dependent glycosyltransferase [Anaeromyxobacteraceae bacterium]|nr:phospholipid carrier-dependent glycosyltransferase [Anaeromyxobacteraceae bacterium]